MYQQLLYVDVKRPTTIFTPSSLREPPYFVQIKPAILPNCTTTERFIQTRVNTQNLAVSHLEQV
jgi:hypothetical protein